MNCDAILKKLIVIKRLQQISQAMLGRLQIKRPGRGPGCRLICIALRMWSSMDQHPEQLSMWWRLLAVLSKCVAGM